MRTLVAVLALTLTVGCGPEMGSPRDALRLAEDIPVVATLAHRVEALGDSLGLTRPVQVRAIPGGYLVTDPSVSDVVDLGPDLRVRARIAGHGKGPGEVETPFRLSRWEDEIGVYDLSTGRVLVFDVSTREYRRVFPPLTGAMPTADFALLSRGRLVRIGQEGLYLGALIEGNAVRDFGRLPADLHAALNANRGSPELVKLLGATEERLIVLEPRSGTLLFYALDSGRLVGRLLLPPHVWLPLVQEVDRDFADQRFPYEVVISQGLAKDASLIGPGQILLLADGRDFFGLLIDLDRGTVHRLVSTDRTVATMLANAGSATLNGDTLTVVSNEEILQVRLALN